MAFKMKGFPYKVSSDGYRKGRNIGEKKVIIPGNTISMKENDGSPLEKGLIQGEGLNTGNIQVMEPGGGPYLFEGDKAVIETPLSLTSAKARKILKDGKVHGKKLSRKQQRYFGYHANK